jgi:asparagine synthase (glutamine-hydrolysing)
MCGFVGFHSNAHFGELSTSLKTASDALFHRGPDDSGMYTDGAHGVGLAHRRLSIIDLSHAGRQPMGNSNDEVQIVFNGEIYNYLDLKRQLEGLGHQFKSNTDTEVLLNAYLQWGFSCLDRLIGMFSIAVWDRPRKRIFLARDRLGKKPLYYYFDGRTFLFGSELKAITAFHHIRFEVEHEAIPLFLHYQYIPAPRTIYRRVFKLMPGTFLVYNMTGIEVKAYWTVPLPTLDDGCTVRREEELLDELDALLNTAVSSRLVSDVPLGALLSGGIDSSLVVALMQKQCASPVRTFSIGFHESGYNEMDWAARIADRMGTKHTGLYITHHDAQNVVSLLPEIYDEPFADSSAIPTYLVCSLARSALTVALSGDGGDEQFGGYDRYWATKMACSHLERIPRTLRILVASLLESLSPSLVHKCYLPARRFLPERLRISNFEDKWEKLLRLSTPGDLPDIYRTTISLWPEHEIQKLLGMNVVNSNYETLFEESAGRPVISRLMRVDQGTYLPDAMLTKVDRASMAVSLEVRVPLLDHRLVQFSANIPEMCKLRNGNRKYLLKKVLSRYIPPALFDRPKMGFGIPIGQWIRNGLKPLLLDYLSEGAIKREGLFDSQTVTATVNEHLTGRSNHQHRLWALLMWEMWRERWLS